MGHAVTLQCVIDPFQNSLGLPYFGGLYKGGQYRCDNRDNNPDDDHDHSYLNQGKPPVVSSLL